MVRTPEPPELRINKSFPRYALELIIKICVVTWLYMQAVGLFFYLVWHNSAVAFREFMFRDFIDYWDKWGGYIQFELTPEPAQWIWSIPTWQDWWAWVIIAVLTALYIWGNRGFPSLNFKVPRTYKMAGDNPYSSKRHTDERSPEGDDDFTFDPSAFGEKSTHADETNDQKTIGHRPYSERERRLKALADHPRTPENEREVAKRKLREMGR